MPINRLSANPNPSKDEYSVLSAFALAADKLGSTIPSRVRRPTSLKEIPSSDPQNSIETHYRQARNEAQVELIMILICVADTANTAGPICFNTRRTLGSRKANAGFQEIRGSIPICIKEGICIANCSKPPTKTAKPNA